MENTRITYNGYTIQILFSGWYSAKSENLGYLKSETLDGIKNLIDAELDRLSKTDDCIIEH